jgi:hypothetical protein
MRRRSGSGRGPRVRAQPPGRSRAGRPRRQRRSLPSQRARARRGRSGPPRTRRRAVSRPPEARSGRAPCRALRRGWRESVGASPDHLRSAAPPATPPTGRLPRTDDRREEATALPGYGAPEGARHDLWTQHASSATRSRLEVAPNRLAFRGESMRWRTSSPSVMKRAACAVAGETTLIHRLDPM